MIIKNFSRSEKVRNWPLLKKWQILIKKKKILLEKIREQMRNVWSSCTMLQQLRSRHSLRGRA